MIRQAVPTSLRQLGDDEVECILSTGTVARDGHVLVPAGCDLTGYRKSPIVLWQHIPSEPVGRASQIAVHQDRITARVTFAPLGVSAQADKVRGLVKSGVVTSMSVGFDPKDGVPLDPKRPHGGQRITKWELLECSFVAVPADSGAVVTARGYRSQAMTSHLLRAQEFTDEASRHLQDLDRAMRRDDYSAALRSHRHATRCVREVQRCFRSLADEAMLDDIAANQSLQTSSGVTKGTSDGRSIMSAAERAADVARLAPSAEQRTFEVAELAPKPPTWSGGSVVGWCDQMRQHLESDALRRAQITPSGLRYSRAQRQAELARLARN